MLREYVGSPGVNTGEYRKKCCHYLPGRLPICHRRWPLYSRPTWLERSRRSAGARDSNAWIWQSTNVTVLIGHIVGESRRRQNNCLIYIYIALALYAEKKRERAHRRAPKSSRPVPTGQSRELGKCRLLLAPHQNHRCSCAAAPRIALLLLYVLGRLANN